MVKVIYTVGGNTYSNLNSAPKGAKVSYENVAECPAPKTDKCVAKCVPKKLVNFYKFERTI